MSQNYLNKLNSILIGTLILVFEHISPSSFFGNLFPYRHIVLILFLTNLAIVFPYFFKRPFGLYVFLFGIVFIFAHYLTATSENFRSSVIFISTIVIISFILRNSDPNKLKLFLRIITYCCLINLLYGLIIFFIGHIPFYAGTISGNWVNGSRIAGMSGNPVLFGYNMVLGFWLVLINSLKASNKNKSLSNLDRLLATLFFFGVIISQSMGALIGLIIGLISILIIKKKINTKFFLLLIFFVVIILMTYLYFPNKFQELSILKRIFSKVDDLINLDSPRLIMWQGMLRVYFENLNFLNFLFGGGQGYSTDLIHRGVHNNHLQILFEYGVIGMIIFYLKFFSILKLIKNFNIYLIGFISSTFIINIFYITVGSINNSFLYILVLIIFFNFKNIKHER